MNGPNVKLHLGCVEDYCQFITHDACVLSQTNVKLSVGDTDLPAHKH